MIIETAIIVAILSGCFSVIGQYMIYLKNKRESDARQQVRDAKTDMRLDAIETKLDEHNGYAKKFEEVAIAIAELRTELKLKSNG